MNLVCCPICGAVYVELTAHRCHNPHCVGARELALVPIVTCSGDPDVCDSWMPCRAEEPFYQ